MFTIVLKLALKSVIIYFYNMIVLLTTLIINIQNVRILKVILHKLGFFCCHGNMVLTAINELKSNID